MEIRIAKKVLEEANIPFDVDCWNRSGLTDLEVQQRLARLPLPDSDDMAKNLMEAVLLRNYLTELILDKKIVQADINKYLVFWAMSGLQKEIDNIMDDEIFRPEVDEIFRRWEEEDPT